MLKVWEMVVLRRGPLESKIENLKNGPHLAMNSGHCAKFQVSSSYRLGWGVGYIVLPEGKIE